MGASCNKDGRAVFDAHLRDALGALPSQAADFPAAAAALAQPSSVCLPPGDATVYEWLFEAGAGGRGWVRWMDTMVGEYKCDPDKRFSQIVVPTMDTVGVALEAWSVKVSVIMLFGVAFLPVISASAAGIWCYQQVQSCDVFMS